MDKFWKLVEALYVGKELKNPETWKSFGVLTNIFGAIFALIIPLVPDLYVGDVDRQSIVNGIATIAFVANSYVHVASTNKIGLRGKK